ncbi:MAG: lysophospholipid acyltransferase family protein [Verrucomicrobiota bacterium]
MTEQAKSKSRWCARLGVFGDLPTKLMRRGLRVTPFFLEPVLTAVWTAVFFGIAGNQRRAVAANLRALHPSWSAPRGVWGAWLVFWNFALTYVDALRHETGTGAMDWAVEGIEHMEELSKRTDGCIILTAHMGNYDIAAPVFASRFNRTLYTVRAPEREPETQALREVEVRRKEAAHPGFRTLYNTPDGLLGIELARLLGGGSIVAVQADRVMFDVSPMDVEVEPGLTMRLPKGPLYLARATGAPPYPLFIVRDGWRRYRVIILPPVELPPRKRGEEDAAAVIWAATLLKIVRKNWRQWYVFEPLVFRKADGL